MDLFINGNLELPKQTINNPTGGSEATNKTLDTSIYDNFGSSLLRIPDEKADIPLPSEVEAAFEVINKYKETREAEALMEELDSFGKTDDFKANAAKMIEAGKETAWDKEVYEDEDSFVDYYTNAILGDNEEMSVEDFSAKLVENGIIDEKYAKGFLALVNKDGNETLSKNELQVLLRAAFSATKEEVSEAQEEVNTTEETEVPEKTAETDKPKEKETKKITVEIEI